MTVAEPTRAPARILPRHPWFALAFMAGFLALLWVIEAVDQFALNDELNNDGIIARHVDGLGGIIWAPLIHLNWAHLEANSLPFLIFGFLVMAGGLGQWIAVTAMIWLISGVGVWLAGGDGSTIGASGIIFGWLAFLLVRGFFARSGRQILLAVVLLLLYGGVLWGVLPTNSGVSWQAHLFGALAGILAARLTVSADRRQTPPAEPTLA